jgi:broad specificity phosphatase PhoE
MQGLPISAVYASPLRRAIETAEIIAEPHQLPVTPMENFREVDVGLLEGHPASAADWALNREIAEDWLRGNRSRSFPGGENQLQLSRRLRLGLERILERWDGGSVVVVSHGGILAMTLGDFCPGVDITRLPEIHNCSITEIALERRDGRLHGDLLSWADHRHLTGAASDLVSGMPEDDTFTGRSSAYGSPFPKP